MRPRTPRPLRLALLALALSAPAAAARAPPAPPPPPPPTLVRTTELWGAVAHNAFLKTRLGPRRDRDLYLVGIRAAWSAPGARRVRLAYTVDLLPAVISTGMPEYRVASCATDVCTATDTGPPYKLIATPHTVYGIGLAPVGLTARIAVTSRLGLVAGASGGIIVFTKPVPDPRERRLNFTGDGRVGITLDVTRTLALSVSYHFNHISNGGAGPVNPGMNSHMIEVGIAPVRH
ncbi:MAG: acyloxyacyl hydrolase [Gemmatimonadaceae bacterium]|nr:acyloxyacyl hydrolase [Gemmatimonadaceae bacterium]